ncbi:MAG: cyclodeaminase/cyclohydrolase family protein [Candidatus Omnitrophica bacterium]|nr:cyclodeaminase/cyclohydrolase family protein [Candidatus Omnitrophota bacterium]
MYCNSSLKRYLNDLADKLPTPGGGSASALVAGLGVSLVSMVVNFTLGKPKYLNYEKELKRILSSSEKLKDNFLRFVDEDVKAYRSKNIWYCLEVPLKVAQSCYEAMKLCPLLLEKANKNLFSDVACAAIFLEAGFWGAYFNVEANLKFIKDKKITSRIRKEILKKSREFNKIRKEVVEKVGTFIRR